MLYKARNKVTEFFDDYSSMVSETKPKVTKGTGIKILTPKQKLQRFPIAIAQLKAGNNSESLSNETRQIINFLYQSKEMKRNTFVYNNIIKSNQL